MKKLGARLSLGIALIVLIAILLVSAAANLLINRQFEKYVESQQAEFSQSLADSLCDQYDAAAGEWNLDYIHGFGMYALNDGYLIKLYDADKSPVWDAENHDMTLCHRIMNDISLRMQEEKPEVKGDFVTKRYELRQDGILTGYADISYYSPYYYNENAFQFLSSLNRILFAAGLLSLLGAAVAGTLLARHILGPVEKATQITREISQGNYEIRLESQVKTTELKELTQAVNQMAGALCEQEKLRKRLVSDVAHELRTPLANVSSQLEAMMEGIWEPSEERLQGCYEEMQRLSGLVADLERLREAESGDRMKREPVELLELASSVRFAFEPELIQRKMECVVEGESVVVYGDKERLHQVLFNLMSNAVKYSAEGGRIRICTQKLPDGAVITVEDQGIGIPKEELSLIFERFYRTDRSRSRKTGGAGIGLAIAQSIVRAHGGRITAESEEGRGSRFTVFFPAGEP